MKRFKKLGAFALGASVWAAPHMAAAQEAEAQTASIPGSFTLSSGVSYSSGDYGELESTEVIAIPVSLTYRTGALKLRVSVPYVMIDGPGSLLSTPEGRDAFFGDSGGQGRGRGRGRGGDSDNSGSGSGSSGSGSSGSGSSGSSGSGSGSSGTEVEVENEVEDEIIGDDGVTDAGGFAAVDNSRSGLGDVNVSALYSFELVPGTYFEPQVKVKLPTASRADRLGTGQVDVTVSADLVQELGALTLYVHGDRKFAGKPADSTIRSTWGAGGGLSVNAGGGIYFGADYSWQQSAFAGREASSEVSGWLSTRINRSLSLTFYGGTGLNDNSADLFGGASLGLRL